MDVKVLEELLEENKTLKFEASRLARFINASYPEQMRKNEEVNKKIKHEENLTDLTNSLKSIAENTGIIAKYLTEDREDYSDVDYS